MAFHSRFINFMWNCKIIHPKIWRRFQVFGNVTAGKAFWLYDRDDV